MMGWASLGKTAVTTFEVSSRVVGGLSPASSDVAITGVCLRWRSSQLLKHCELFVHELSQSHCCSAGLVSLYCIWRWPPPWPHLFILVTLAEVSTAAWQVTTDFHTQGDQVSCQSVVSLLSDLPLP